MSRPKYWPLALLLPLTIACAWVARQASAEPSRSAWNLRDHIPLEEVVVQSHRGAGALSPENSIEAFELAWSLGTIPEADLRTSSDGVIVAFHDGDFKRILPHAPPERQKQGVADLTWAELAELDIGAWKGPKFAGQRIPKMTEVYGILRQHPRRRFYIDFKNVDLAQLARESKAVYKQLILASTDYQIIRRWKELAPESATLHWMGGTEQELSARLEQLRASEFADITQLQIHVRIDDKGQLTPSPEFLLATGELVRQYNVLFQTLPWESKDPQVFWRLMDLGSASFATDYPDVAMQAIRDYYAQAAGKSPP